MPVAVPVLSIADNANGTGCVATITGATSLTTNTLYSQAVNGELGTATWTSRGSRSGNGTISVSLTTMGYYWWKVVSVLASESDVSNLVYQPLTDGNAAIHERLLLATQARLQSLTYAAESTWPDGTAGGSISTTDIVIFKTVQDLESHRPSLPCIVIGLTGKEQNNKTGGTNLRDEVVYPVGVCIFAKGNNDLVTNRGTHLLWRQQTFKAANNWRASVTELNRVEVEPDPIIPLGPWAQNHLASALVLKGVCWQARGLT